MIIFDFIGHMVSTESEEELHQFAIRLGLKKEWYQMPSEGASITKDSIHYNRHYDLTTSRIQRLARKLGAVEVTPSELVCRAWWHISVVTAKFAFWQKNIPGKPPVAMYIVIGGKLHGSAVSAKTLKDNGIRIK